MTDEERAYTRGICHTYSDVFNALATAFREGHDIHWLREQINAQWDGVLATQTAKAAL